MWILHTINAAAWVVYAIVIEQYGLILLSAITIPIDIISAMKSYKGRAIK
jgi:hypothetical protein